MFFNVTCKVTIHADLQRVAAAAYREAIGRAMKITINPYPTNVENRVSS